ncbi:hypothetical protein K1719_010553 [Acacia pycnantha]|nr:hypothetical protein K1719_010553 [Acacia pycnantha]
MLQLTQNQYLINSGKLQERFLAGLISLNQKRDASLCSMKIFFPIQNFMVMGALEFEISFYVRDQYNVKKFQLRLLEVTVPQIFPKLAISPFLLLSQSGSVLTQ